MIAVGVDAAFSNMGFARVRINPATGDVQCLGLRLVSTEGAHGKTVRVSSDKLRRAQELVRALHEECQGAAFAFVEVPTGSQSASSATALGIAVGVLASCPVPIVEVSPMEVKTAVTGNRKIKAGKPDVIAWALSRWPNAPWLRAEHKATVKGKTLPAGRLTNDNEHLADAMASVAAGMQTPEFKRMVAVLGVAPTPVRAVRKRVPLSRKRVPL